MSDSTVKGSTCLFKAMPAPAILLCAFSLLFPTRALPSPPPVSDETVIDHGFRYLIPQQANRCVIGTGADSTLLAWWSSDGPSAIGCRGLGTSFDVDTTRLTPTDGSNGSLDLAETGDGRRAMAWVSPRRDWLPPEQTWNLNVRSIGAGSPGPVATLLRSPQPLLCATLERCGGGFILAWISRGSSGDTLKSLPLDRDLLPLGAGPAVLATDVAEGSFGLAAAESTGIVLWIGTDKIVRSRLLDSAGRPAGEARSIAAVEPRRFQQAVACRFGDAWLAAWSDAGAVSASLLDAQGGASGLPQSWPGQPGYGGASGLAVCAHDTTGLIAWRQTTEVRPDSMTVLCMRISPRGSALDPLPIPLGDGTYAEEVLHEDVDQRTVDCAWTAGSFLVLWSDYESLPTARGRGIARDLPRNPAAYTGRTGIRARWIGLTGEPLGSAPLPQPRASDPWSIGICPGPDGAWHCLITDNHGWSTFHSVVVAEGSVQDRSRYSTVSGSCDEGYYDPFNWCIQYPGAPRVRPWGSDAAVAYARHTGESTQYYFLTTEEVIVDRVSPDGTRSPRLVFQVGSSGTSEVPDPEHVDVAQTGDALLAVFATRLGNHPPNSVQAVFSGPDARVTWMTPVEVNASWPSIVCLDGTFLAAWIESDSTTWALRGTALRPNGGGGPLTGAPLASGPGRAQQVSLTPGDAQVLCVFSTETEDDSASTGWDVRALRLDETGASVDTAPIPVCTLPGDQTGPRGVWDGHQYAVAWIEQSEGPDEVWANRVDRRGRITDGDGFFIAESPNRSGVDLATNGAGLVAVAYGGNRIRTFFDDVVPILLSNLTAQAGPEGNLIRWEAQAGAFTRFLVERAADPEGEWTLLVAEDPSAGAGPWEYLDGSALAGSLWFYRVRGVGPGGESLVLGPIRVAAPVHDISFRLDPPTPHPIRDAADLSFRLPRPGRARLQLYTTDGRLLRTFLDGPAGAGSNVFRWDARDGNGRRVPAGAYVLRLQVAGFTDTQPIVVLR